MRAQLNSFNRSIKPLTKSSARREMKHDEKSFSRVPLERFQFVDRSVARLASPQNEPQFPSNIHI